MMLKNFFNASDIKDICPNCETACSATDVLCPNCGENLDELFEKLPEYEEKFDVLKGASKNLPFLNWLTPLLLILSPFLVSLATILPSILVMHYREPFKLIWQVVPSSILASLGSLLLSAIPLFFSTTASSRVKLGKRGVVLITTFFSICSGIALWFGLQTTNMMTKYETFGFFFHGYPAQWVYWVIGVGFVMIVLNLMVIIGQSKTA